MRVLLLLALVENQVTAAERPTLRWNEWKSTYASTTPLTAHDKMVSDKKWVLSQKALSSWLDGKFTPETLGMPADTSSEEIEKRLLSGQEFASTMTKIVEGEQFDKRNLTLRDKAIELLTHPEKGSLVVVSVGSYHAYDIFLHLSESERVSRKCSFRKKIRNLPQS
jgi:hypothetical protein